jgi:hypothetical protein
MNGGQRLGAGRPPNATGPARRRVIQVRLTDEEFEQVKETAAHYKVDVSNLVRAALGLS